MQEEKKEEESVGEQRKLKFIEQNPMLKQIFQR
jgi:hypothetical protein